MIPGCSLWLLDPDACDWAPETLRAAARHGAARAKVLQSEFSVDMTAEMDAPELYDLQDGVAVIRQYGPLFDDDLLLPRLGMSGYGGLSVQYEAAQSDPAVRAVFFDIDSPGGVAAPGLEDLANEILAGRAVKPSLANVRHVAASAAYWLAASATAVVLPETGELGSIGAWTLHIDISAALDQMGVKPTLIFSGARKVDGNPFEPLPAEVRDDWQAEVDFVRQRFAAHVAAARTLPLDSVMKTEAALYHGAEARGLGLADEVMPRKAALRSLIESVA